MAWRSHNANCCGSPLVDPCLPAGGWDRLSLAGYKARSIELLQDMKGCFFAAAVVHNPLAVDIHVAAGLLSAGIGKVRKRPAFAFSRHGRPPAQRDLRPDHQALTVALFDCPLIVGIMGQPYRIGGQGLFLIWAADLSAFFIMQDATAPAVLFAPVLPC